MKDKILNKIKEHKKIALFLHKRPDGDSLTSSYGLGLGIKELFPDKEVVVVANYEDVQKEIRFLELRKEMFVDKIDDSYLTIVGDCAVKERILNFEEYAKGKEKICYDHHQNKINFDVDLYWSEPSYPASSIQANEILNVGNNKFSEHAAISLLVGILTDTGFFKFSLNNPKPVETYAKLLPMISEKSMSDFFIKMNTKNRKDIEISAFIYKNIQYKGKVAYVLFPEEIINKYGYSPLKFKLGMIGNIENTQAWAFFLETKIDGELPWKGSLRSATIDVNAIANKHNGGGHIRAAGCFANDITEIENILIKMGK